MSRTEPLDYMGVLSLKHISPPSPMACFGSPEPAHHLVELTFHEATWKAETRQSLAGKPIARVVMSSAQFGHFIMFPSEHEGSPVTLTHREGFSLRDYDPQDDAIKKTLKDTINAAIGDSPQAIEFFERINMTLTQALENGRLKKQEQDDVAQTLSLIASYLKSSEDYYMQQAEAAIKLRAQRLFADLCGMINSNHASTPSLPLDNGGGEVCDPGALLYGCVTHGETRLFGDTMSNGRYFNLTLSTATASLLTDRTRYRYTADREFLSVGVSLDSYALLIQGRIKHIPATIMRREKKVIDGVDVSHTQEPRARVSDATGSSKRNELIVALTQLSESIQHRGGGKKAIAALKADVDDIFLLFKQYGEFANPIKHRTLEKALRNIEVETAAQLDDEINALPEQVREQKANQVKAILSSVKQITDSR